MASQQPRTNGRANANRRCCSCGFIDVSAPSAEYCSWSAALAGPPLRPPRGGHTLGSWPSIGSGSSIDPIISPELRATVTDGGHAHAVPASLQTTDRGAATEGPFKPDLRGVHDSRRPESGSAQQPRTRGAHADQPNGAVPDGPRLRRFIAEQDRCWSARTYPTLWGTPRRGDPVTHARPSGQTLLMRLRGWTGEADLVDSDGVVVARGLAELAGWSGGGTPCWQGRALVGGFAWMGTLTGSADWRSLVEQRRSLLLRTKQGRESSAFLTYVGSDAPSTVELRGGPPSPF